jgi:hypothetical protein
LALPAFGADELGGPYNYFRFSKSFLVEGAKLFFNRSAMLLDGRDTGRVIMRTKSSLLRISLIVVSLLPGNPAHATDECGLVSRQGGEPTQQRRFELLAEYSGRAFIDTRTCLVWRLDFADTPTRTLDDAMGECASLGQGGPNSEMGWQLPTLAELTSVDSEDWNQHSEFGQFHIPPMKRSEIDFWTSTPWLGRQESWSVVQFSARTTIAHPIDLGSKAAVWCVRGFPAKGLR